MPSALGKGTSATDVFAYTMIDGDGATSTTTLTINITGTNDAPLTHAATTAADAVTEAGVHPANTPFPGDASATCNVPTNANNYALSLHDALPIFAAGSSATDVSGQVATSVTGTYGSVQ